MTPLGVGCEAMPYKARVLTPIGYRPRQQRLSPKERGYDRAHREWRRIVLARDPICRMCGLEPATHADHIISVSRRPDLRLDPSNGQGLGHRCHSVVTAKYDGGFGNPRKDRDR